MTRKSKREIERSLDDLDGTETFSLQEYMWANLKDYHDGDLSSAERRLVDNPEAHLTEAARRRFTDRGECR
jgi:hypothetical protein